jgi:hypothetical protein
MNVIVPGVLSNPPKKFPLDRNDPSVTSAGSRTAALKAISN